MTKAKRPFNRNEAREKIRAFVLLVRHGIESKNRRMRKADSASPLDMRKAIVDVHFAIGKGIPDSILSYVAEHLAAMPEEILLRGNEKNSGRKAEQEGVPLDVLAIQCSIMQQHLDLEYMEIEQRATNANKARLSESRIKRCLARARKLKAGTLADEKSDLVMDPDTYRSFEIVAMKDLIETWNFDSTERNQLRIALKELVGIGDKEDDVWAESNRHPGT